MYKELLIKILKISLFRDLIIGLVTTFKYIFKRRVTLNYPNEKGSLSPRESLIFSRSSGLRLAI